MGDAAELLEYLHERNAASHVAAAAPRDAAPGASSEADVAGIGKYMGPSEPLPPHLKDMANWAMEEQKKMKRR